MTNDDKRRFKTTIAGKTYVLIGKGTDECLQAVSDLLNTQLAQLKKAMPNVSNEQLAVLMAFNAISKQFELQDQLTARNDEQPAVKQPGGNRDF